MDAEDSSLKTQDFNWVVRVLDVRGLRRKWNTEGSTRELLLTRSEHQFNLGVDSELSLV